MDAETLETYDQHGRRYARQWLGKPMPAETARVVQAHFRAGRATVDVGSGSGRDVAWLSHQGIPAVGIEASETLLEVSREAFPELVFRADSLPALAATQERFAQVLCRNVLMHLSAADQVGAVVRLVALMEQGGVMVLTWRTDTGSGEVRDADGRLYAHVDPAAIEQALTAAGARVLAQSTASSGSSGRSLAVWVLAR